MRTGKLAAFTLVLVLTALSAIVWWRGAVTSWMSEMATFRAVLQCAILAVLYAAILIPCGIAFDRAVVSIREYIESADSRNPKSVSQSAVKWLRPIVTAVSSALDRFSTREQALRQEIHDFDVRHRVKHDERKQVECVFQAMRDGVIVTNAFDEVVLINRAAAESLAIDASHALHESIDQVIPNERLCSLIRQSREKGDVGSGRHIEFTLAPYSKSETPNSTSASEDTASRVFDITLLPVEGTRNETAGVAVVLHDKTRERDLARMKTEFVSKASHELRTPLASIRASVEMLTDSEMDGEEEREELNAIIQNELKRLNDLMESLLTLSDIEAGTIRVSRSDCHFGLLVENAVAELKHYAAEKSIAIHARTTGEALAAWADKNLLHQVVCNLLHNAITFTPDGGRVSVACEFEKLTGSIKCTVSDTGLGIPPDKLPCLFDTFYRIDEYKRMGSGKLKAESRKSKVRHGGSASGMTESPQPTAQSPKPTGAGIGLSVCKHIVETVHGGQIGVESKLGLGTKVWFSIPKESGESKGESREASSPITHHPSPSNRRAA